ncbi:hypothetical protein AB685_14790 [Bacillus sp. LL01]|uniref:DUF6270 domain-containing protein n=1 Tax=Bacillus sp. LL01 TaxID=1665556 RepID=UPI00064D1179|nr:DUF6270 domain-containing protein [Bacillus sp. LL01]KMJ58074.1 hypothetical protein AB685_14790 [Bacillus sp. LL01]
MSNITKIGVLGSCVTRDNFNSTFNPNYKSQYDCIVHQNQASLISLMSEPIPYNPQDTTLSRPYDTWQIKTEFTKEFLTNLVDRKPEYLILDFFGDVYYGCIQVGENQYLTNNRNKLWKTDYYKAIKTQVKQFDLESDKESYMTLWRESVDKLFVFLKQNLPNCKIVININDFMDTLITKDNQTIRLSQTGNYRAIDVELINNLVREMESYISSKYEVITLDMTKGDYRLVDNHPWGRFFLHFNKEFYYDFLKKLHVITGKNEISLNSNESIIKEINEIHKKLDRVLELVNSNR